MTQPLQQTFPAISLIPIEMVREQIHLSEQLLENTMQIFLETLGVSHCLLLDRDLDAKKVIYQTPNPCENLSLVDSSRYLCHRYQNRLKSEKMMVLSREDCFFPPSSLSLSEDERINAIVILPLQVPQSLIGFLCLYYQGRKENNIESAENIICQLAKQCALIVRQLQYFWEIDRDYRDKEALQTNHQDKVNEYLAHITHELRAPLAGILGFARMLQEQIYGTLTAKQYQYINAIASSGEHLLAIVNDFQDLSKIEANYEELLWDKIAVEDVCLASLSIIQAKAEEQELDLQLSIAANVDFCWADQQRLKQILVNLLSNAIKFTEIGSVTLKVESCEKNLTFSVIDTGIGISLEEQQKLFQPFQQIHNSLSRKHKGTGLGLALSRKLAKLHGGNITLISEKGKGSCFILEIPKIAEIHR